MPRAIVLVTVAALALALSGCSVFTHKLPTQTSTPVAARATPTAGEDAADAAATTRFYTQALVWKDCDGGFQCASAKAPIDWAHPAGASLALKLIRKPASGTSLGSLFVNPGGPGVSAIDFVRQSDGNMDKTVQQHYDIVGFDPRGVGQSTPVTCGSDDELTHYLYDLLPGSRGSAPWIAASKTAVASLGASCLQNTGALLGHLDTASTARDLDMLRSDVGDAKLHYFGFSYGTLIGSVYAGLFPKNVGSMVLDGVTDPAVSYDQLVEDQAVGFESNLNAYLTECLASDKNCPFNGSLAAAQKKVAALLAQVDAHPIENADGRMLGSSTLVTAIILPLYSTSTWDLLDQLFSSVMKGSAAEAFQLADEYNDRSSNGAFTSNTMVAFQAIDCLDYRYDDDPAHMTAEAQKLQAAAPVIGRYFSYGGVACDGWPVSATDPVGPVTAAGSAPILVVGTTNDPATPYAEAEHLADSELQNGHLVTYHGAGHTAYGRSNSCVTNAVDDYLVDGTVPKTDPEC